MNTFFPGLMDGTRLKSFTLVLDRASARSVLSPPDHRTFFVPLLTLGVSVFPIGIGDRYDSAQLSILAGSEASSNVVRLQRVEDLPTVVTLGNSFLQKLCAGEPSLPYLSQNKNKINDKVSYKTKTAVIETQGCP